MSDEWGGWKNRETHMFQANWENDEKAYNTLRDVAYAALVDNPEIEDADLGEALVTAFREHLAGRPERHWANLVAQDIGDWDQIDRAEVGDAIRDDLDDIFTGKVVEE